MDASFSHFPPMESRETFKSPFFSYISSRSAPILFALCVSTSVLLQFGVPLTTPDQKPNYPLIFMASLTFLLGMALLPLRVTINSLKPLNPKFSLFISHMAKTTLISSFATLVLALPCLLDFTNSNTLLHWSVRCAIQSGLMCFTTAMLYLLVNKMSGSCRRQYTKVAFLTLCIATGSLYTETLFPSTIPYNSITYQIDRIYRLASIPIAFALGTILLILGVAAPADSLHTYISVLFKERFAMLTLAMGFNTLLITGTSLMVYVPLVDWVMIGGF